LAQKCSYGWYWNGRGHWIWIRKGSGAFAPLPNKVSHLNATEHNVPLGKTNALLRESIPRQVDKKSRVPEEEIGVWNSQGGKRANIFLLYIP